MATSSDRIGDVVMAPNHSLHEQQKSGRTQDESANCTSLKLSGYPFIEAQTSCGDARSDEETHEENTVGNSDASTCPVGGISPEQSRVKLLQQGPVKGMHLQSFVRPLNVIEDLRYTAQQCPKSSKRDSATSPIAQAPQYLDFPDIINALGCACCDPHILARLALVSTSLQKLIMPGDFATRISAELCKVRLECVRDCCSLEQLAVSMSVASLCSTASRNHLYFPYGGGLEVRAITRHLLYGAALLAKRHPRLKIHIDAHTGAGAPQGIATSVSFARAHSVSHELISLGAIANQITMSAWGKRVSSRWSEPEDDTAARVELFFCFGLKEFPQRESYYDLVPQESRMRVESHAGDSSEEEDLAYRRRARRAMTLLASLDEDSSEVDTIQSLDDSSEVDTDEEDEEEEEGSQEEEDREALLSASR